MKSKIKSIILFLAFLLSLSLIGCGTNNSSTAKKPLEEKPKQTVKISPTENVEKVESNDTTNLSSSTEKESEKADALPKASTPTTPTQKDNKDQSTASKTNTTTPQTKSNLATVVTPSTPPTTTSTTSTTTESPKPATTVTFSVQGPKDRGTIIGATKVNIKDGETIFDILLQTAKKQGIVIESRGSGATAYIEGIDNIYEFDYGTKSGWVFKLNGNNLTKSVGMTQVKDGDRIECYYTE